MKMKFNILKIKTKTEGGPGPGRGHYTPPAKGMHICARKLEIILNENIAENHNYMSSKWLLDFEFDSEPNNLAIFVTIGLYLL